MSTFTTPSSISLTFRTPATDFLLLAPQFSISSLFYLNYFYFKWSTRSKPPSLPLQSSFAQSLLSSRCPYLFLSFVFSWLKRRAFFMKKIIVEWQCWDLAQESWRCESHTNTKTTMKYVWIFLSKKKLCSTNPKCKIVVATSHLSKPDGQVGVIVLW